MRHPTVKDLYNVKLNIQKFYLSTYYTFNVVLSLTYTAHNNKVPNQGNAPIDLTVLKCSTFKLCFKGRNYGMISQ